MLGSFPPAKKRWCMEFFYPNYINDMWRIFGLLFHNDKDFYVDVTAKTFRKDVIENMLRQKHIGLYDTATAVRRTNNSASDKDLEVVETTNISALLDCIPMCKAIVTTGQKATELLCQHFQIEQPQVGGHTNFTIKERSMRLYRMPSSSRAYPMKVERKAEYYRALLNELD